MTDLVQVDTIRIPTCPAAIQSYGFIYQLNIVLPHLKVPLLDTLLSMPGFLETSHEADNILAMVRSRRDQESHRKMAAESAVYWCTIQQQFFESQSASKDVIEQSLTQLRVLQCELSVATEDFLKARRDVGDIRALIRKRGFPVHSRPRQRSLEPDPESWQSDSEVSSVAGDSDVEI
jgi:hypothetical protein